MYAFKRIPVSEEVWKLLGKMKEAGQTYDALILNIIQSLNRKNFAQKVQDVRKKSIKKLTPLDEL